MVKTVKLGGVELPNVTVVHVQVTTPADEKGFYRETTFAPVVTIERDVSEQSSVAAFKLATNEDGRKNITNGAVEFFDGNKKQIFNFNLQKAIVTRWVLHNPSDPSSPTTETIELRAGEMETNAGGSGAKFAIPHFA